MPVDLFDERDFQSPMFVSVPGDGARDLRFGSRANVEAALSDHVAWRRSGHERGPETILHPADHPRGARARPGGDRVLLWSRPLVWRERLQPTTCRLSRAIPDPAALIGYRVGVRPSQPRKSFARMLQSACRGRQGRERWDHRRCAAVAMPRPDGGPAPGEASARGARRGSPLAWRRARSARRAQIAPLPPAPSWHRRAAMLPSGWRR
jgi:hypothetical protein